MYNSPISWLLSKKSIFLGFQSLGLGMNQLKIFFFCYIKCIITIL